MSMGVDEPRHDGRAAQIDDLRATRPPGFHVGGAAHCDDPISLDREPVAAGRVGSSVTIRPLMRTVAAGAISRTPSREARASPYHALRIAADGVAR